MRKVKNLRKGVRQRSMNQQTVAREKGPKINTSRNNCPQSDCQKRGRCFPHLHSPDGELSGTVAFRNKVDV